MAISINWGTSVITVPKADTTLVSSGPPEIRALDLDVFRLALKDLEDSQAGMPFLKTHNHVAPLSVGGVTLARSIELLAPYTVTFENGNYQVNLTNANSNISDRTNLNSVGLRTNNTAGLTFSTELLEVWKMLGLDSDKPVTHTDTQIAIGASPSEITIAVSGDPQTTQTLTRQ